MWNTNYPKKQNKKQKHPNTWVSHLWKFINCGDLAPEPEHQMPKGPQISHIPGRLRILQKVGSAEISGHFVDKARLGRCEMPSLSSSSSFSDCGHEQFWAQSSVRFHL